MHMHMHIHMHMHVYTSPQWLNKLRQCPSGTFGRFFPLEYFQFQHSPHVSPCQSFNSLHILDCLKIMFVISGGMGWVGGKKGQLQPLDQLMCLYF